MTERSRLTWFDWVLIIGALVLVAHMPALVDMYRGAGAHDAALDMMGGRP